MVLRGNIRLSTGRLPLNTSGSAEPRAPSPKPRRFGMIYVSSPMSLEDILSVVPEGSAEEGLARQIDFERLPRHLAVIRNGRWAEQRHLPRVEGHRAGIESVREVVEGSARLGIRVLTLYAFSVENWKRPVSEVSMLMMLLKRYLRLELNTLLRNNIRFRVIGRAEDLAPDVRTELAMGEEKTAANTGMLFNIALNYGGRAEIVEAAKRLLQAGVPAEDGPKSSMPPAVPFARASRRRTWMSSGLVICSTRRGSRIPIC